MGARHAIITLLLSPWRRGVGEPSTATYWVMYQAACDPVSQHPYQGIPFLSSLDKTPLGNMEIRSNSDGHSTGQRLPCVVGQTSRYSYEPSPPFRVTSEVNIPAWASQLCLAPSMPPSAIPFVPLRIPKYGVHPLGSQVPLAGARLTHSFGATWAGETRRHPPVA